MNINTNLSSLITQSSLKTSTSKLNEAIERMTTGCKINHARDNAANFSINTKLGGKLSSYSVAQDNALMGIDMLTTAMDSLDLLSSHLSRMRDLAEQAANGTYGASSLNAIQAEVSSRLVECVRVLDTTEYNKIKLFEGESSATSTQSGDFIQEVKQLSEAEAIAQGYKIIKTADELQAMQDDLSGKYILMNDIDLAGYDWTAVGANTSTPFRGEFNGNGYVISNLTINKPTANYQGLFGHTNGAEIKNIGLENADITGYRYVAALVGDAYDSSISNCYSTGSVTGQVFLGGLVGEVQCDSSISNSYSAGSVTGESQLGGLVGDLDQDSSISNSYSTNSVTGSVGYIGGLVGDMTRSSSISNSYSTGRVADAIFNYNGFIGNIDDSSSCNNNYWNIETSGQTSGYYTTSSVKYDVTGVTTEELNKLIEDGILPSISQKTQSVTSNNSTIFQVGINSDSSSQIKIDTSFSLNLNIDLSTPENARNALTQIDDYLKQINSKQTEFGAAYNRLESVIESIGISIENLTSTKSTICDADIAEVSSEYIKNQILQQASSILMATANQSPAIALQLL